VHQNFPQTIARDFDGRTRVEIAAEHSGLGTQFPDGNARYFLYARRLAFPPPLTTICGGNIQKAKKTGLLRVRDLLGETW
jgi:hypothetical protein